MKLTIPLLTALHAAQNAVFVAEFLKDGEYISFVHYREEESNDLFTYRIVRTDDTGWDLGLCTVREIDDELALSVFLWHSHNDIVPERISYGLQRIFNMHSCWEVILTEEELLENPHPTKWFDSNHWYTYHEGVLNIVPA